MTSETREEWLTRKREKPTYGQPWLSRVGGDGFVPKPGVRVRRRRDGITVYTTKPECPCGVCNHAVTWDCDPNGGMADSDFGCSCCDEICS